MTSLDFGKIYCNFDFIDWKITILGTVTDSMVFGVLCNGV